MKYIYSYLIFIMSLLSFNTFAQQTPDFTFWRQNMSLVNPAYVGSTNNIEVNTIYRNQFSAIDGAPKTFAFSANSALNNNFGIGLDLVTDKVFIQSETNFFLNFSYKLLLPNNDNLFLGLKAGGSFFNVDFSSLQTQDPINQGDIQKFNPNFGLGMYYKSTSYFISLSVPRILKSKRYEEIEGSAQEATDATLIMFGGGYIYQFNRNIQFIPALMSRYIDGAPFGLDFNFNARFNDRFELGAGYRINDSFNAMASFQFTKNINFGFAYDFATSDIKTLSTGGAEFLLKVKL